MLGEKWTRASLVIPVSAVNKRELKAAPHTHKRGADSSSLWEEQDGTRGRRRVLEVGLGGVPPERGFVLAPSGRPAWLAVPPHLGSLDRDQGNGDRTRARGSAATGGTAA